jgi:hypothetical protein
LVVWTTKKNGLTRALERTAAPLCSSRVAGFDGAFWFAEVTGVITAGRLSLSLVVRQQAMRDAFPEFVRLRRRWFAILLGLTFLVGLFVVSHRYDSAVEIVGFAFVAALITTTVLSWLSVPVVFLVARRRLGKKAPEP